MSIKASAGCENCVDMSKPLGYEKVYDLERRVRPARMGSSLVPPPATWTRLVMLRYLSRI